MRRLYKPVKHGLMFFIAIGALLSLILILVPRKVHGAIAPTFCVTDKSAGDNLSCIGTKPSYCISDNSTADLLSCAGAKPTYCLSDQAMAGSLSCQELGNMYVLDVLKTGKYPTPPSYKKFFSSSDLNDVVTFQRLKETVGTF